MGNTTPYTTSDLVRDGVSAGDLIDVTDIARGHWLISPTYVTDGMLTALTGSATLTPETSAVLDAMFTTMLDAMIEVGQADKWATSAPFVAVGAGGEPVAGTVIHNDGIGDWFTGRQFLTVMLESEGK